MKRANSSQFYRKIFVRACARRLCELPARTTPIPAAVAAAAGDFQLQPMGIAAQTHVKMPRAQSDGEYSGLDLHLHGLTLPYYDSILS